MPDTTAINPIEGFRLETMNVSDLQRLEGLKMDDLLQHLRADHPFQLLDHRLRSKWEVGLAKSLRRTWHSSGKNGHKRQSRETQSFRHCIFVTGESERVTT